MAARPEGRKLGRLTPSISGECIYMAWHWAWLHGKDNLFCACSAILLVWDKHWGTFLRPFLSPVDISKENSSKDISGKLSARHRVMLEGFVYGCGLETWKLWEWSGGVLVWMSRPGSTCSRGAAESLRSSDVMEGSQESGGEHTFSSASGSQMSAAVLPGSLGLPSPPSF